MDSAAANALRGMAFFSLFWPSFSSLGFAARQRTWQTLEPDYAGQTWLVTGASTGIGREIARRAAGHGARVIAVARSEDKLGELAQAAGGAVVARVADLSRMPAVLELARELPVVDVLVNNVGVMFNRPRRTPDGLDAGFATNLLGHYLLTEQTLATGRLSPGAAIVNMSSGGAYNVPLSLPSLEALVPYDGTIAYAYHKRAQLALNEHWRRTYGDRASFYVMHPGWVATPGVADAMPVFHAAMGGLLRAVSAGADTALWLAAVRPAQRRDGSIWFDRAERSAHLLPGTRDGAPTRSLIELLEQHRSSFAQQEERVA